MPILWWCGQPGEGRVDPLGLTALQGIIIGHLQKYDRSVVLLNGMSTLCEDQIDKVLRPLHGVRGSVVMARSKLLVPLDHWTLTQKDRALIEESLPL